MLGVYAAAKRRREEPLMSFAHAARAAHRRDPRRVSGQLRLAAGVRPAAPRRPSSRPQVGGADHAPSDLERVELLDDLSVLGPGALSVRLLEDGPRQRAHHRLGGIGTLLARLRTKWGTGDLRSAALRASRRRGRTPRR